MRAILLVIALPLDICPVHICIHKAYMAATGIYIAGQGIYMAVQGMYDCTGHICGCTGHINGCTRFKCVTGG